MDDLLAPFRKQVEESGMYDGDLDQLGEELRNDVWQEQLVRKATNA